MFKKALAALIAGLILIPVASAQDKWPTKPIRYVVPYPPGGSSDIIGRLMAKELSEALGVSVVVENIAGASGTIGSAQVARSAPDGYTILHGASSTHGSGAVAMDLPYHPIDDFTHIGVLAEIPNGVAVSQASGVTDIKALLAYLKDHPDTPYGHAGVGSSAFMSGELFRVTLGLNLVNVPYKGTAPVVRALMGNEIELGFGDVTALSPGLESGRMHVLAVTSKKRVDLMPDIPTLDESGLKGFESVVWLALFAPKNTPADVTARLNTEINKILGKQSVQERLSTIGASVLPSTPEEQKAYIERDIEKWKELAQKGNLKFK
jgi:tripartite-type tricarboxylate transporter receptor subunit TctC